MPQTRVIFYQDANGSSPVWDWLKELRARNARAYAKCLVRIARLATSGHELRRPEADFLRDGIYELRARLGTVNYRLLYVFHGRNVAILVHGLIKEEAVSETEISRAVARKNAFVANPKAHTYEGRIGDA